MTHRALQSAVAESRSIQKNAQPGKHSCSPEFNVAAVAAIGRAWLAHHDTNLRKERSMNHLRQAFIATILGTMMGAAALAAEGDSTEPAVADDANATLDLTGGAVAAGVGFVWGHGDLTF